MVSVTFLKVCCHIYIYVELDYYIYIYIYIYILDVGIVLRLVSLESRELSVVESYTYPRDASSGRSDCTVFPDNLYINKLVFFKNHL